MGKKTSLADVQVGTIVRHKMQRVAVTHVDTWTRPEDGVRIYQYRTEPISHAGLSLPLVITGTADTTVLTFDDYLEDDDA